MEMGAHYDLLLGLTCSCCRLDTATRVLTPHHTPDSSYKREHCSPWQQQTWRWSSSLVVLFSPADCSSVDDPAQLCLAPAAAPGRIRGPGAAASCTSCRHLGNPLPPQGSQLCSQPTENIKCHCSFMELSHDWLWPPAQYSDCLMVYCYRKIIKTNSPRDNFFLDNLLSLVIHMVKFSFRYILIIMKWRNCKRCKTFLLV